MMSVIKKIIVITGVITIFSITDAFSQQRKKNEGVYIKDLVPDSTTAIKIAEAIWLPIYGEKVLREKPYNAELKDSTWLVYGTLPLNSLGGVAFIEIRKTDCKILKVWHEK